MAILRKDILSDELTTEQKKILVRQQFTGIVDSARHPTQIEKSRSPSEAKTINDFYGLVNQAIENKLALEGANEDADVFFTEEYSDIPQHQESITFSLVERRPGHFSEGAPTQGSVRNFKPILREVGKDPDNPGYMRATFGMWYDNIIRFTCWARTNRTANQRAIWFEELMEDYKWFFAISGVPRVLFWQRLEDTTRDITYQGSSTTKYYGRPLEYFVKTEKIRVFTEKELENIILNVNVSKS